MYFILIMDTACCHSIGTSKEIEKNKMKIFAEFHGSELRGVFNDFEYKYFKVEDMGENRFKQKAG